MNTMRISKMFSADASVPVPELSEFDKIKEPAHTADKMMVVARFGNGHNIYRVPFVKLLHKYLSSGKMAEKVLSEREVVEALEEENRRTVARVFDKKKVRPFLRPLSKKEFETFATFAPILLPYGATCHSDGSSVVMMLRILRTFPTIVGKIIDGTYQREISEMNAAHAARIVQSR